ncbi:MAG: hypothetical protein KKH91_03875 [Elusimicrobia bacterium]|nr:hypothetical protein [Elusimicrobiota bacterium]
MINTELKIKDTDLRLEKYQIDIYNGLRDIGEEISSMYCDGVRIFKSDFSSRPYILAHLAREIEGSIRDIYASTKKAEIKICPTCGNKKKSSQIDEICEVLGVSKDDDFAKRWHKIAKEFHKYAHRQGGWNTPREKESFNALWKQFEIILLKLVGQYLGLIILLDQILKNNKPTENILKTLPNLLQNEPRKRYFFKKLISIQWFQDLYEQGYFLPGNAPGPVPSNQEGYFITPEWNVLPYLEKISIQIKEKQEENKGYIEELLDIIKTVTEYHVKNDNKLDNYRTWWYFVKILCNLPKEAVTENILDLIPIWLGSKFTTALQGPEIVDKLLPKFLENPEDIKKAEKITEYTLALKTLPQKEGRNEFDTVIESYYLKESFIDKKYAGKIGENCSVKLIENISENIKKFLKSDRDETYLSSYSKTEHYGNEPLELLAEILKQILISKSKANENETKSILKTCLQDKSYYFKKMAIYVMGYDEENANKYKDIYFEELEKDVEFVLLDGFSFGDELKHLFNNFKELTLEQIDSLQRKITEGPGKDYKSDPDIWKQKRYKELSHIQVFKVKHDELQAKTKINTGLSAAIGEIKTSWEPIEASAPLKVEDLLQKSNKEIADYLVSYNPEGGPWPERDFDGLCSVIVDSVKIQPEKFINDLDSFKETAFIYVRSILSGVKNAWNDKKTIDWMKVFDFIKEYIDRNDYWEDNEKYIVKKERWKTNHIGLAGPIADIVREGAQEDFWKEEHFKPISEIFDILITGMLNEKDEILKKHHDLNNDPVTHAMNSPFGRLSEALFLCALRIKRVEEDLKKEQQEINWEKCIKSKYQDILDNSIPEGYTWLGRYLTNFNYLDKDWTVKNIDLNGFKDDYLWECFIIGYLSAGIHVSLYDSMQPHYKRALGYKFKKDDTLNRLIHHICVGYLLEKEDFTDKTLFGKLIEEWDVKKICEIISCFWVHRKDDKKPKDKEKQKKIEEKILEFWSWVYKNKFKGNLTDEDKKILAELAKLSVFLPKIDSENSKWLLLSAPYAGMDFDSMFFIEYLNELKEKGKSINYIGEIYLKMLETSTPDYKKENIIELVEYLYEAGKKDNKKKEQADEICNIYGSRGAEFLRPLWEKNNKEA